MRLVAGLMISFCICASTQAFADDSAPPAASAQSTATTTSSSTPATAAKPAATDSTLSDAQDKRLRSQGYKREVRNGATFYCRSEAAIGTRFENKVCRSATTIAAESQDAQDVVSKAQMNISGPISK